RGERWLQVERHPVVDLPADPAGREMRLEDVPIARPDDVLVEDVRLPRRLGEDERRACVTGEPGLREEPRVALGDRAPATVPPVQVEELGTQRGRLHRVQPGAEAERRVHVWRARMNMA